MCCTSTSLLLLALFCMTSSYSVLNKSGHLSAKIESYGCANSICMPSCHCALLRTAPTEQANSGKRRCENATPAECKASEDVTLEELAGTFGTLPPSSTATVVSTVAALLDSSDLPASRERAMFMLASEHVCGMGAAMEHACLALFSLTVSSRAAAVTAAVECLRCCPPAR
jgi:hypothetical protein